MKKIRVFNGDALRQLRAKSGLTQQQLADACDLFVQQVSSYERGETNPSVQTLFALAAVLEVEAKDLSREQKAA